MLITVSKLMFLTNVYLEELHLAMVTWEIRSTDIRKMVFNVVSRERVTFVVFP